MVKSGRAIVGKVIQTDAHKERPDEVKELIKSLRTALEKFEKQNIILQDNLQQKCAELEDKNRNLEKHNDTSHKCLDVIPRPEDIEAAVTRVVSEQNRLSGLKTACPFLVDSKNIRQQEIPEQPQEPHLPPQKAAPKSKKKKHQDRAHKRTIIVQGCKKIVFRNIEALFSQNTFLSPSLPKRYRSGNMHMEISCKTEEYKKALKNKLQTQLPNKDYPQ